MRYLLLDDIKKHCNIDEWFHDDDAYIASIGEAVERIVELNIDDSLDDVAEEYGGELPQALKQAMLLLCGTYYANRESVAYGTPHSVPDAYSYIIALFQRYHHRHRQYKEGECACKQVF